MRRHMVYGLLCVVHDPRLERMIPLIIPADSSTASTVSNWRVRWRGFIAGNVVAVGDVNGDGIADILIARRSTAPGGLTSAGSVYVVYGQKCGGLWGTSCTPATTVSTTSGSTAVTVASYTGLMVGQRCSRPTYQPDRRLVPARRPMVRPAPQTPSHLPWLYIGT